MWTVILQHRDKKVIIIMPSSLSCGYPHLFSTPFGSYYNESNCLLLVWEVRGLPYRLFIKQKVKVFAASNERAFYTAQNKWVRHKKNLSKLWTKYKTADVYEQRHSTMTYIDRVRLNTSHKTLEVVTFTF